MGNLLRNRYTLGSSATSWFWVASGLWWEQIFANCIPTVSWNCELHKPLTWIIMHGKMLHNNQRPQRLCSSYHSWAKVVSIPYFSWRDAFNCGYCMRQKPGWAGMFLRGRSLISNCGWWIECWCSQKDSWKCAVPPQSLSICCGGHVTTSCYRKLMKRRWKN